MAYTVKINQKELERLNKAISKSLYQMARTAADIMIEKQVIPKKTGALEASQGLKRISKDKVALYYDVPYARRVYYLPEKQIHKKKRVDENGRDKKGRKVDKWNDNRNLHARPRWVEAVFAEEDMTAIFAGHIKQNLGLRGFGDASIKEGFKKHNKVKKPAEKAAKVNPVNPVKPAKKPSQMSASEYMAWYMKNKKK